MIYFFLLLALFLSSSCTLYPPYCRPTMETPLAWRIPTEESTQYANCCWWTQLQDPVLNQLIEEALESNQDIKVAIYTVDEFLAQLGIVNSQLYPQISATVGAERERQSTTLTPLIPGTSAVSNAFSLVLNASYFLDIWGLIRSASDAALASLLAEVEVRRAVVLGVVSSVAISYIQLRQFDKQLIIAQETLDSRNKSYDLALTRFQLGLTSELQVEQAKSEIESAQAELERIQISIALEEDLLSILIGRPPMEIPRGNILDEIQMPPSVPAFLPSELLNQRPDILAAEQNLIAANAQIGVAKAQFFPQITLTGAFGSQSAQLGQLLQHASNVWEYGFTLLQEIFTGGKLTNQVRLAEAQKNALIHQYESTILNAFKEVNDALISHQIALQLREVLKERVETVKRYLQLSIWRYEEGQTDYLTVLDAERQLFRAELDYTQAQGESFTTLIAIYQSLGGGWVLNADADAEHAEKCCGSGNP